MHSLRITSLLIATTLIFSIPSYGMSSNESDDLESVGPSKSRAKPMAKSKGKPRAKPVSKKPQKKSLTQSDTEKSSSDDEASSEQEEKQTMVPPSRQKIKVVPSSSDSSPEEAIESATSSEEEGYVSEDEYRQHQKAHDRYFRRNSRNARVRAAVERFTTEYQNQQQPSVISLDGLSSRSRILLVREITTLMLRNIDDGRYWREEGKQKKSNFRLRFKLENQNFSVENVYTLRQPGGVILSGITSYVDIQNYLEKSKTLSANFAKSIKGSRRVKKPIKKKDGTSHDYLNSLNFLLDLEVARRLQGDTPENEYDQVPVGSGIANFLELSSSDRLHLDTFFKRTGVDQAGSYPFHYGIYNIFEGAIEDNNVTSNRRKPAVKKIIRTRKEESGSLKNSRCEEIHQHYREIFPGSEEESDPYSDDGTSSSSQPDEVDEDEYNFDITLHTGDTREFLEAIEILEQRDRNRAIALVGDAQNGLLTRIDRVRDYESIEWICDTLRRLGFEHLINAVELYIYEGRR